MKKPQAVIFDMDGVLVDTEPFHILTEKRMFRKMSLDISDEEHAGYMGIATDVMWEKIIRNRNLSLDIEQMTELTIQEGLPFFYTLEKIDPMPGLIDLLEKLKAQKIPMAVASSSDAETIRVILEKSGLRKYFQHAISSSEVGKSKPEPDVFLYAAKLLNISPENCLVIEDSKNGIKAAKNARMLCIAYTGASTVTQDTELADMQYGHFAEIENRIMNLIDNY